MNLAALQSPSGSETIANRGDAYREEPAQTTADNKQAAAELRTSQLELAKAAAHSVLGLSPDQAIADAVFYNTYHASRGGAKLPGGELVALLTAVGPGIDGKKQMIREIHDGERGGFDEDAITAMGALALGRPTVERIILAA